MDVLEKPVAVQSSLVLEHPAATPEVARAHFAGRLSVETDVWDVHTDVEAGVAGFVVVDPRSREAYAQAHIPGAINIPHREIDETTTAEISRDSVVVVYCWGPGCNAGTKAGLKFANLGFLVKEMIGGFEYWVREGCRVEGTNAENPQLHGF